MDFGWIVLGVLGFMIVLALLHVIRQMASERECSRRQKQTRIAHSFDDTITHLGRS
jgi:hypothetical protein